MLGTTPSLHSILKNQKITANRLETTPYPIFGIFGIFGPRSVHAWQRETINSYAPSAWGKIASTDNNPAAIVGAAFLLWPVVHRVAFAQQRACEMNQELWMSWNDLRWHLDRGERCVFEDQSAPSSGQSHYRNKGGSYAHSFGGESRWYQPQENAQSRWERYQALSNRQGLVCLQNHNIATCHCSEATCTPSGLPAL
ncbi:unnamed protein product [Cercospora beticola]|nr:unnamed protein product [Cercospora beticola]